MFIDKLPLIDLHCHLDGSITLEIARKLSNLQGINLTKKDDELLNQLSVPKTCENLVDYLECFALPCSLMQTKEGISEAVYLVCENIKNQGVVYLELRFAPQKHCEKGLSQDEVIVAALNGLKKTSLHTNLILCMMRGNDNQNENLETIELCKKYLVQDKGVVGIDIAGEEERFPIYLFEKEFTLVKKYNIPTTIHAGEFDDYNCLKKDIEFGAKRLGHGLRVFENNEIYKEIINKNIGIEFCPTTTRQTNGVKDIKLHPVKKMINDGVKININTDDMGISRITLKDEYLYCINNYDLNEDECKKCIINAIDVAFTTDDIKIQLKKLI